MIGGFVCPATVVVTPRVQSSGSTSIKTKKPGKVTGVKAKAKKKSAAVTWKKVTGAKDYQVQYSTNKKFKKASTKTTTKTKLTLKKLKKKKKYYIRVRAYRMNDGDKVWGKWSSVKKVKIKK